MKVKSFTDLEAWKFAHKLVIDIYKILDDFPKQSYALNDQMRRSALSISSNIAEGFARKTRRDKRQFYIISLGSLAELQSQMLVAKDLGYLNEVKFGKLANQSVVVRKLINGLIKSAEDKGKE